MSNRYTLKTGEHVDLDSGIRLARVSAPNEGLYRLYAPDALPVYIPRDELRAMAELAGYDVSDPEGDDGGDDS